MIPPGTSRKNLPLAALALSVVLLAGPLAGCITDSGGGETVTLQQAGSSTVLPVAEAWAEGFEANNPNVRLVVSGGGSGAGFEKFCRGETDISDASRPIKDSELENCRANGLEPFEIPVAIDGLSVVVNPENDWVDHLTVDELNRIWTANESKQVNRWNELRPEWPDEPIKLFGAGTDSGTFDYFIEVIIHPFDGDETNGRSDYTASENDNVLVQGVARDQYALGYFGLSYAVENQDKVKIVPIDDEEGGEGPVFPTSENVSDGTYAPLSRPLFMYTDGPPTGVLKDYFEFGLSEEGQELVSAVGYVEMSPSARQEVLSTFGGE